MQCFEFGFTPFQVLCTIKPSSHFVTSAAFLSCWDETPTNRDFETFISSANNAVVGDLQRYRRILSEY